MLVTNVTSNKSAIVALNGSANSTTILSDPDAGFATGPVAGRIGIYYSSGYRINNSVGSAQRVVVGVLNANGL